MHTIMWVILLLWLILKSQALTMGGKIDALLIVCIILELIILYRGRATII